MLISEFTATHPLFHVFAFTNVIFFSQMGELEEPGCEVVCSELYQRPATNPGIEAKPPKLQPNTLISEESCLLILQ